MWICFGDGGCQRNALRVAGGEIRTELSAFNISGDRFDVFSARVGGESFQIDISSLNELVSSGNHGVIGREIRQGRGGIAQAIDQFIQAGGWIVRLSGGE